MELREAASWTHRRTILADLDGNGAAEQVVLTADVALDARGRALWEDGHRWALLVEESSGQTLLYGAFVPNGHVEAAVLTADAPGSRRHVLVRERTPHQSRTFVVEYERPGAARLVSAQSSQVEQWIRDLRDE